MRPELATHARLLEPAERGRHACLGPAVLQSAEHWIAERRAGWERGFDRLGELLAEEPGP